MTRCAVAAASLLGALILAPATVSAQDAAAPRYRLPAGTTVHVVGSRIACATDRARALISCFRFVRRGGKLVQAPGGYGFVLKGDGNVLVNRLRGERWWFEFGRVTPPLAGASRRTSAARAPVRGATYRAQPADEFWVPGTRAVCRVVNAGSRGRPVPALECGFADALGVIAARGSYGAGITASGKVYVVSFGERRRPRTVYDSRAPPAKTIKVSTSSNVFINRSPTEAVTCGGIVVNGLRAMTCGTSSSGVQGPHAFVVVEDATVAVFALRNGSFAPVYERAGGRLGRDGPDEAPTDGASFTVESGEYFKLAGTTILCGVTGAGEGIRVHCGRSDRLGLGAPGTFSVSLGLDSQVVVRAWSARRASSIAFRLP